MLKVCGMTKVENIIKLLQCLFLRKDSTVQPHSAALSLNHKWVVSERNQLKLSHPHFLCWKALSNHLATDMVFPQRVCAYRANSCYANGAENNVCETESCSTCCRSHLNTSSPCGHIDIKAKQLSVLWVHHLVFLFTGCSSLKNTTFPQLKPELSTGNSGVIGHSDQST